MNMMRKATHVAALLVLTVRSASAHGLMLTPPARSAADGLLHRGGSMWYTQSTTIGCSEPNVTADVHTSMHAGDLCPGDTSGGDRGLPKVPTVNQPSQRTWLAQGCFDSDGLVAPCTDANAHTDWTKFHPWRAPGNAPVYDSCGVAGAAHNNNSNAAGGWGFPTGYGQGFPGSKLPPLDRPPTVWKLSKTADVSWSPVANHGGGYQYSLCPAGAEINEECFHKIPLHFASKLQTLRYIYVNDTSNRTEVEIPATRITVGTVPKGSTWTKNPVPCGSFVRDPEERPKDCLFGNCGSSGNGAPPQFEPPTGCDDHCWGYQPCNVGFEHPSYEGWCDAHPAGGGDSDRPLPASNGSACATHHKHFPSCSNGKQGQGCCHTSAYMEIIDKIEVPDVPPGKYVIRWRWDAEQTPQIWVITRSSVKFFGRGFC